MIKFVSSAAYQLVLPSTPGQTVTIEEPLYHISLDGTASPPVLRHYQPWPTGEGGADKGLRLEPRSLVWRLFVDAATESALEAARTGLYKVLRPSVRPLQLKVTRADGGTRCLDVYVSGAVEFAQSGQMGYSALATFRLMAPDPIWYTPTERSQALGLTSSSGSANVDYLGNWFESPVIELTGELSSPQVEDAQGNTIFFQGHTIPAGQTYVVDLRPGAKTVINSSSGAAWPGNDVSEFVVKNTGWNEFRLLPGPLAAAGSGALNRNPITATFDSKGPGAAIVVKWYDRWLNL